MNPYLYVFFLLLELFFVMGLAIYSVALLYSSVMGAPYVPTSSKRINEILEHAQLKKNQVFLELGSGDGRIVRQAVKKYGVKGIGVDINLLLTWWSRFLAKQSHLTNITFPCENIFDTDIKQADVVYLFLMPELIRKLAPRFLEMKKNSLIISHGFKVGGLENKLEDTIKTKPFPTFFYRI